MSSIWGAPLSTWTHFLSLYQEALTVKDSSASTKQSLADLDVFVWNELPAAIKTRDPHHLTVAEYLKLVHWKLQRGQFRARLLGFAKELKDDDVRDATTKALKALATPRDALEALVVMRGCGPATASAVLSSVDPSFPYMSDELLLAAVGERKYTPAAYINLVETVRKKVAELDAQVAGGAGSWTARDVEKAVFACAMLPNKAPAGMLKAMAAKAGSSATATTTGGDKKGTATTAGGEEANGAEPVKRGRGRPRKNPIEAPKPVSGEETPKRKRGRPRKNKVETGVATPEATTPGSVQKRGRGRPRKSPKPEDEAAKAVVTPGSGQKRGRGRPRKNPVVEPAASPATPGSGQKRGRGRPRKYSVEAEDAGGNQDDTPRAKRMRV